MEVSIKVGWNETWTRGGIQNCESCRMSYQSKVLPPRSLAVLPVILMTTSHMYTQNNSLLLLKLQIEV